MQEALRQLGIVPNIKKLHRAKQKRAKANIANKATEIAQDDSDKYEQFSAKKKALFNDLLKE